MFDYSLGMFSVHELTSTNMDDALNKVAALGFKKVEFAGFFGHEASEIKDMLDKYGLTVSSTHTPMAELVDNYEKTVAYHKAIGNSNIIFPMEPLDTQEKLDVFAKRLETLIPKAADDGIALGYHNHLHEFSPNVDGSMIYEQMIDRTKLFLEIDTGWAHSAGQDPIEMIEKFGERVRFIHLRDSVPNPFAVTGTPMLDLYGQIMKFGIGRRLGEGGAPVEKAHALARAKGIQMVIECEAKTPDCVTSVAHCVEYVKNLDKK